MPRAQSIVDCGAHVYFLGRAAVKGNVQPQGKATCGRSLSDGMSDRDLE